MAELHLTADDDHVQRLAHENDPVRAVVELIWNAIDAEASEVSVEVERDEALGAISKTIIKDTGHGIDRDELATTFGKIGGSWKRLTPRTKNNKRSLHGERGEGRLRAFALGDRVEWASHSLDSAGELHRVIVTGTTDRRHVFTYDVQPASGVPTGTVVTALNDLQKTLMALEAENATSKLLSHFAPVLLNDDDLRITYLGEDLDPIDEIALSTECPLTFTDRAGNSYEAALRIIEWKTVKQRAIYYGPDAEHFLYEESAVDVETSFHFSAYVTWEGLNHEALSLLGLGDMSEAPVASLWTAAREGIRAHFRNRRRERRRDQLEKWKQQKVYPFEGEAQSATERAERAIFDVVAGTIAPHIPAKADSAKVTLGLLRNALRQDPEQLGVLFGEVASLSAEDRESLTRLLGETTLSGIIKAAHVVTGRNKFLVGIERLIFPPEGAASIGERDHLHPMLERELWIFGEEYHLMSSERGLTEMARNHLRLQGLPATGVAPVKRWDDKAGRVDLHLAAKMEEFDVARHLLVELKAPGILLGRKELDQVEDYANTILDKPVFATDKAAWDVILVGTDFDTVVENRLLAGSRSRGLVMEPERKPGRPLVRVFVRRWRDILDENRRRLRLFTDSLEHDPSLEDGLRHIKEQYANLLPVSISGAQSVGGDDSTRS